MTNELDKKKVYRLKKSWKYSFNVTGILLIVLIIAFCAGFYTTLNYMGKVIDNDFDSVVYSYDAKVSFLQDWMDVNNSNTLKWDENVKITISGDNVLVSKTVSNNEIIQVINDIEGDISEMAQKNAIDKLEQESLADYNERLGVSLDAYNKDVARYNQFITSKYSKVFSFFGKTMEKKQLLDLSFTNIS